MPRKPPAPTSYPPIQTVYPQYAPVVAQYTDVSSLIVTYVNKGATGFAALSGPAAKTIEFNTYYNTTSQAQYWKGTVAHEVRGHHDTWNQIVREKGVTAAWTDYYDIDKYAKAFFEKRWVEMFGVARVFSLTTAKECYLDCRSTVSLGLRPAYLTGLGLTSTNVPVFAKGYETIYAQAVSD